MSLLVVGSVAYDSIKTYDTIVEDVLGGSATYCSIAASSFCKVLLVGVVGCDFREEDKEIFVHRGINIEGLVTDSGNTFRWKGEYTADFNQAITHETQLNVFATFNPIIPPAYKNAQFVFLANIDPDLQRNVLAQIPKPKFSACDTMNFWINTKPDSLKETISQVDMLFINDAEIRTLTNTTNVLKAARIILDWGPKAVVIKKGEYGAALIARDGYFVLPAYPLEKIVDTTGAGDSFAGGFLGALTLMDRIDFQAMQQALAVGTVVASWNVQSFSINNLLTLSRSIITDRYNTLRSICSLPNLELQP